MKQIDLATKLGYSSERQLQRIEEGGSACNNDKIMELSQILNVSTDYLLFGKEFGLQVDNNDVATYLSGKTSRVENQNDGGLDLSILLAEPESRSW